LLKNEPSRLVAGAPGLPKVPLDRARSKITHIKLQAGLLLVVTSEHMLYVIDPESGQIQWSFLIGDRKLMSPLPRRQRHVCGGGQYRTTFFTESRHRRRGHGS